MNPNHRISWSIGHACSQRANPFKMPSLGIFLEQAIDNIRSWLHIQDKGKRLDVVRKARECGPFRVAC